MVDDGFSALEQTNDDDDNCVDRNSKSIRDLKLV